MNTIGRTDQAMSKAAVLRRPSERVALLLVIAAFAAAMGVWTVVGLSLRADTVGTVSFQAEAGTRTGVTTISDASAAGGSAVQFGSVGGGSDVCPPYPAFPDASCTGWQHTGVALKTVPGQVTSGTGWNWEGAPFNYVKITGNDAVLDGLDISGCVYVATDIGVNTATIKRSRITGNCDYMIRYADFNGTYNIKLIDVELNGSAVQMKGNGFSWLRVNAHSFSGKAAMTGSNTIIEDSYIHDNKCTPPDHQSGIGTNGGASNIVMRHNNVDLTPSDCTSGGISNYDDFGPFDNVLIEKNLMNSAGYCLKAGFESGASSGSNMRVIDNVFGRKYYPECGAFGPVSNWLNGSGNVWSGNTWGGGAAATSSHMTGSAVNP